MISGKKQLVFLLVVALIAFGLSTPIRRKSGRSVAAVDGVFTSDLIRLILTNRAKRRSKKCLVGQVWNPKTKTCVSIDPDAGTTGCCNGGIGK